MTFIHLDMDLLTTQQKIEFARRDFLHVAGANDSIKWDECGMYTTS